ncbi:MAG TPA: peptidoglycan bridge formation glycyltransferase FemA/FemB family protein, partial [Candidatus Rifleibacterium sp.]|nr:peptidoglycan bridge formation glycyltransferase FemA/FemB family protein [Candidatus Rifleibacterium sp.]
NNQNTEVVFLLASHNSDLLAGVIMVISENTALFLFGASANNKRNYMASYAVHWEAIRQARARSCTEYDMGGVSPGVAPDHPFYGLYNFKSGFGGQMIHRSGTWDFPLDKDAYTAFRNAETILCGLGG